MGKQVRHGHVAAVIVFNQSFKTNFNSAKTTQANRQNYDKMLLTDEQANYLLLRSLQVSEYQLTLVASDGGIPPRSAAMEIVVMVMDANDHAPQFEERRYQFDLEENADIGTVVGQVSATDHDDGENAVITYSFSRQTQVLLGVILNIIFMAHEHKSVDTK